MRHPPTTEHNYLSKVIEFQHNNGVPQGTVASVTVRHDEWCDVYTGGFCNCNAVVEWGHPESPAIVNGRMGN